MPIRTDGDRPNELRQRGVAGAFTEGAERSNVETVQGVMDTLLANKDKMSRQAEQQLGSLFDNAENSYGRARAVGMTAAEASRLVTRAFQW